MTRASDRLFAVARLLAGRAGSEWIAAIAIEADLVTSESERLQWALGALRTGLGVRGSQLAGAVAVQAALLLIATVAIEWRSGLAEVVLPVSGLATAALAFRFPGQVHLVVLSQGGGLPAAHLAADLIPSLRPWYQYQPFDALDWAVVLFAFVSCAVAAAITGVKARVLLDRLHTG